MGPDLPLPSVPTPFAGRALELQECAGRLVGEHGDSDPTSPCPPVPPQMQLETEKERVSLLETLLQTQKELADASQQLERLRQDMKVQKLKEQVWRVVLSREEKETLIHSLSNDQFFGTSLYQALCWVLTHDNQEGVACSERGRHGSCPQGAYVLVAETDEDEQTQNK